MGCPVTLGSMSPGDLHDLASRANAWATRYDDEPTFCDLHEDWIPDGEDCPHCLYEEMQAEHERVLQRPAR